MPPPEYRVLFSGWHPKKRAAWALVQRGRTMEIVKGKIPTSFAEGAYTSTTVASPHSRNKPTTIAPTRIQSLIQARKDAGYRRSTAFRRYLCRAHTGFRACVPAAKKKVRITLDPAHAIQGYHIAASTKARRRALLEHIRIKGKKERGERTAAKKTKQRLNALRIYRKYSDIGECRIITRDMRFLDRTYHKKYGPSYRGETRQICGQAALARSK